MISFSQFLTTLFIFLGLLKAAAPLAACDYQMLGSTPFKNGNEGWTLAMRQLCTNNPMGIDWTADGSTYSISVIYEYDTATKSAKGRKNATMSNTQFFWTINVNSKQVCDLSTNILRPCIFTTTPGAIVNFVVLGKVAGVELNPNPIDGTHFKVAKVQPLALSKQTFTFEQGQTIQAPRKNAPFIMLDSGNQEHYWLTTPNQPMTLTIMETKWDKKNPMPPWAILFGMTDDLNDDSTWSCVGSGSNFVQRCIVQPMPVKQPFALALYPNGFHFSSTFKYTVTNPTAIVLQPTQNIIKDEKKPYYVRFNQISNINMDAVLLDLYQPDSHIRDIGLRATTSGTYSVKLSLSKSTILPNTLSYSQFQVHIFRAGKIKPDIGTFDNNGFYSAKLSVNDAISLAFKVPTKQVNVVSGSVRLFIF